MKFIFRGFYFLFIEIITHIHLLTSRASVNGLVNVLFLQRFLNQLIGHFRIGFTLAHFHDLAHK
jgi:hypothetical protein